MTLAARLFRGLWQLVPGQPPWVMRGLVASILEGSAFSIWFQAVGGNFLTGLALHLGAGGFTLGLLGALPPLAMVAQVLLAPLVAGLRRRRGFLATFCALQRFGWSGGGLLATLLPPGVALPLFVAVYGLSWLAVAPVVVVWQGYMSDLVPLEVRGRYFGLRATYVQAVGMATLLLCGWLLDRWPGAAGLRLVYGVGLLGAALNLACWSLHPEVPVPAATRRAPGAYWQRVLAPLRRPGAHRTATLFFAAWGFAQGLAMPFYPVALLQDLGVSYGSASVLATVASVAAIATSSLWGRLQDTRGDRWTVGILTALLAAVPLLFVAARTGGWPVLALAHVVQGAAFNGLMLVSMNLNLKLAPLEDRPSFLAAWGALGGLAGFVAPLLAGPLTGSHLGLLFAVAAALSGALSLLWWLRLGARLQAAGAARAA